jgi:hypothetical protein
VTRNVVGGAQRPFGDAPAPFWREKVVGLTQTFTEAQSENQAKGFRVDEISFSIGVGAKGHVLFVAEGSVEATLAVKLRRPLARASRSSCWPPCG